MSFRRQVDVTSVVAVSILPFSNIFCSGIMLSCCNFNDIDVITDFGNIGTISFGNIATMQVNRTSLLNCVPYVLTCQRALRPYMLTCLRALRAYVLKCHNYK